MIALKQSHPKGVELDGLKFINSQYKREQLKSFTETWKITTKELKTLYVNGFISVKSSKIKVTTLPTFFWLNALFSAIQLTLFAAFFVVLFFSPNKTLAIYLTTCTGGLVLISFFFYIYNTMLRPIRILCEHYHMYGKYNNFHD
jgi:hypothetical protein